jgi:Ran-binding protein 9/10
MAFKDIKSDKLYPSVGMKKPGEWLRVNFGQSAFVYDIDSLVRVRAMFLYIFMRQS